MRALNKCVPMLMAPALFLLTASLGSAGGAPVKVTAEELTAAYLKNATAAAKKYGDPMNPQELIVVGKVEKIVDGTYGKIAKLKGSGKAVVSCLLRREDEASVKQGEQLTIKGRCRGYFPQDKAVDLNGGVVQKNGK